MKTVFFLIVWLFVLGAAHAQPLTIAKTLEISDASANTVPPVSPVAKIAVLSAPRVIGRYSQSIFNVALATTLGVTPSGCEMRHFTVPDESPESLRKALDEIRKEGIQAVLAPLTSAGTKNLLGADTGLAIFVPTVHKRDFPEASQNIVFGSIDYVRQIEALLPHMSDSIAVFYDDSAVGKQLKASTEEVFVAHKGAKKTFTAYPVDPKGDNIVSHLSRPAQFHKKSVIFHVPVVKSSLLAAHMTFTGVKERNILSTQINIDPNLLHLTQYHDRKNMIIANSLVEFPPGIYASNALMNNDIAFDWVHYASSVGIDYLVAKLNGTPRSYTMRIVNNQVIYPIELLRPKESGFEPLRP
ncbi:MAG: hypothetical protein AB1763_08305 [Campylobacterota bacterium]